MCVCVCAGGGGGGGVIHGSIGAILIPIGAHQLQTCTTLAATYGGRSVRKFSLSSRVSSCDRLSESKPSDPNYKPIPLPHLFPPPHSPLPSPSLSSSLPLTLLFPLPPHSLPSPSLSSSLPLPHLFLPLPHLSPCPPQYCLIMVVTSMDTRHLHQALTQAQTHTSICNLKCAHNVLQITA